MSFSEHSEEKEEQFYTIYVKYEPRPVYFNQKPIFFQFRRKVCIKESHSFSQLKGCLRRVGKKFYKEELELKKEQKGIEGEAKEQKPDDVFEWFDIVAHKVKSRHVTKETFKAWLNGLTKEKAGFNLLLVKQKEPSYSQEHIGSRDDTEEQGVSNTNPNQEKYDDGEDNNDFNLHISDIYFPEDFSDILPILQTSDLQVEDDRPNVNFGESIIRTDPNTGNVVEEDRSLLELFPPQ